MNVKGEYLGHTIYRGFVYGYLCPQCKRTFRSTAPELSEPTLCGRCYGGWKGGEGKAEKERGDQ